MSMVHIFMPIISILLVAVLVVWGIAGLWNQTTNNDEQPL